MLAKIADISRLTDQDHVGEDLLLRSLHGMGSPQVPAGYWLGDGIFLLHSAIHDSWLPSEQVNKRGHPRWKLQYLYPNLRIDVITSAMMFYSLEASQRVQPHLRGWDNART